MPDDLLQYNHEKARKNTFKHQDFYKISCYKIKMNMKILLKT